MGTWTRLVYTEEQQARLQVDKDGNKVEVVSDLPKPTTTEKNRPSSPPSSVEQVAVKVETVPEPGKSAKSHADSTAVAAPTPVSRVKAGKTDKMQAGGEKNPVTLSDKVPEYMKKFRRRALRYLIFKINSKTNVIEVDRVGKKRDDIKKFMKALPSDCRYCLFNHEFKTSDGRLTDKMYFIFWAPAAGNTRSKMAYTTEKMVLRSQCDGCIDVHADSFPLSIRGAPFGIKPDRVDFAVPNFLAFI